jgi:hypothetical protein
MEFFQIEIELIGLFLYKLFERRNIKLVKRKNAFYEAIV